MVDYLNQVTREQIRKRNTDRNDEHGTRNLSSKSEPKQTPFDYRTSYEFLKFLVFLFFLSSLFFFYFSLLRLLLSMAFSQFAILDVTPNKPHVSTFIFVKFIQAFAFIICLCPVGLTLTKLPFGLTQYTLAYKLQASPSTKSLSSYRIHFHWCAPFSKHNCSVSSTSRIQQYLTLIFGSQM